MKFRKADFPPDKYAQNAKDNNTDNTMNDETQTEEIYEFLNSIITDEEIKEQAKILGWDYTHEREDALESVAVDMVEERIQHLDEIGWNHENAVGKALTEVPDSISEQVRENEREFY